LSAPFGSRFRADPRLRALTSSQYEEMRPSDRPPPGPGPTNAQSACRPAESPPIRGCGAGDALKSDANCEVQDMPVTGQSVDTLAGSCRLVKGEHSNAPIRRLFRRFNEPCTGGVRASPPSKAARPDVFEHQPGCAAIDPRRFGFLRCLRCLRYFRLGQSVTAPFFRMICVY